MSKNTFDKYYIVIRTDTQQYFVGKYWRGKEFIWSREEEDACTYNSIEEFEEVLSEDEFVIKELEDIKGYLELKTVYKIKK